MKTHHLRVIAILLAWLAAVIGLVVLLVQGVTEGTGFGVITGVVGTLTPALVDSLAVERRRRTPGQHAVEDDRT